MSDNRTISECLDDLTDLVSSPLWGHSSEKKNGPQEIVIKPEILDTSNVEEGEGSRDYRPTSWDEYVGQDNAKNKVQSYIKGCKQYGDVFPHTFLSAPPGMGKTLFSSILATQLGKKLVVTTGGELKNEQMLVDKIVECEGGVIFIDECNRINKRVGFFMLPVMELFEIGGKKIKPFTIIMATTHKGDISKDLDALIQRCISVDLEPYTDNQLKDIIKTYNKKQYSDYIVDDETLLEIVRNSRQTPRVARHLTREFIFVKDLALVKNNNQIVKDGITKTDVMILEYLSRYNGLGKNSIAKFLRMKPQTFENEFEPYLIYKEFIEVSSRRKITDRGKEFLKCL